MINYISTPFRWFFKLEAASGLVLLFAAIIAIILILDTFKYNLTTIFPSLDYILENLYESIKDVILFTKDLLK